MDVYVVERPPEEPCHAEPSHRVEPPSEVIAPKSEKRLIAPLRQAAQTEDPTEILSRAVARAATAPSDPAVQRLAETMAELAATGGTAHRLLVANRATVGDVAALAARHLPGVAANEERLRPHAARLLERAHRVAHYLEQGPMGRSALRRRHEDLGRWLAVSGEDDPPGHPVNVPTTRHPTFRATVEIGARDLPVRYVWAGPEDGSAQLVLLLHGHSSKLEEYDRLVSALLDARTDSGRPKYAVLVPDLPSCGYSGRIDHDTVAAPDEVGALLSYLEQFAHALTTLACESRGLRPEVACVAGGSLGGNLTLRLAERRVPWARRFAAWSAASVWSSLEGDLIKGLALRHTRQRLLEDEEDASRRTYFREVFADTICATGRTQPQMWYRDGWPCRPQYINRAIWDRREIYGPEYRRWHWRLAYEQLVFSHVEVRDGRAAWQSIAGPLLLVAGREDNYRWTHIHDRTRDLAHLLRRAGVPGRCVLLNDTGHSIHDERPRLLAQILDGFID